MTVAGQDFIAWNENKFSSGKIWATGDTSAADVSAVPEPKAASLVMIAVVLALSTRSNRAV